MILIEVLIKFNEMLFFKYGSTLGYIVHTDKPPKLDAILNDAKQKSNNIINMLWQNGAVAYYALKRRLVQAAFECVT